jgi:hypothetical protein
MQQPAAAERHNADMLRQLSAYAAYGHTGESSEALLVRLSMKLSLTGPLLTGGSAAGNVSHAPKLQPHAQTTVPVK